MSDSAAPRRSSWPEATVVVVLLLAGLGYFLTTLGDSSATEQESSPDTISLSAAEMKKLRATSTFTEIPKAPKDASPTQETSGLVVHPTRLTAVFDAPAGKPIAKLRKKQAKVGGNDTWVPVIEEREGWLKIMLPSRPNASVGWIQDRDVKRATSRHLVRVHTGSRTMEIFEDGHRIGEWTVAVGASDTPTPSGRTFLLGQFTDTNQAHLSVIIPLGMHSDTLDTYGGGPGTVAFHGWNDPSVFGKAISHGCVRIPDDALDMLRTVPLGTTVLIDGD